MKLEKRARLLELFAALLGAIACLATVVSVNVDSILALIVLAGAAFGLVYAWVLTIAVALLLPAANKHIMETEHEYDGMLTHKYTTKIRLTGSPYFDGFLDRYASARTLAGLSFGAGLVLAVIVSCVAAL
tara:strand:+ start:371 stop:760 length:390 start_codon:yes stop_codon:yes gene_type:complete